MRSQTSYSFVLLQLNMTSHLQFSYWGKALKAGLTPELLINILQSSPDTTTPPSIPLEPYSTFGILIELLEFSVELESIFLGFSTNSVLKIWIHHLYPACSMSRADRLERAIRKIALPVQCIRSSNTNSVYLNRIWKPKTTFQPGKTNYYA